MGKGSILVAPLNWGLGHATRCIPIIKALQNNGYTPLLASDGVALDLLKKEFPELECYELPSLKIKYAKKGSWFKFKIILQLFRVYRCVLKEQQWIKKIGRENKIIGIISDNRLGLYHQKIPCAIISHQLKVFSGNTTSLTTKLHQYFIAKYDECWVPDNAQRPYLSGKLGHVEATHLNLKYIGIQSRFQFKQKPIQYDVLILLSGPEPQRSLLEKKVLSVFKNDNRKIVLVRGVVETDEKQHQAGHILTYNFLTAKNLETLILQSEIIIARSGYTTLMDLAKLNKKAFFIPTPGQSEQQYLAKRLQKYFIAPYCQQKDFNLVQLEKVNFYKGLDSLGFSSDFVLGEAFSLFEGK